MSDKCPTHYPYWFSMYLRGSLVDVCGPLVDVGGVPVVRHMFLVARMRHVTGGLVAHNFSCGTHAACDTGRGPGRRYIAFIERTVMYWPPPVPTLILHFVTTSLATVQSAFSPHTADTMSIDVFDRCSISIYCAQFVDRCLTECRWMCSIDVRR